MVVSALVAAACGGGGGSPGTRIADPVRSVPPEPEYARSCSPSGIDRSLPCIQVTLQAIDNARAKEGVGPMVLPANFAELPVPEQLFVALTRERVDRGLRPFAGLSGELNANAQKGADGGDLPPRPGPRWSSADGEWIGSVANALDATYLWLYDDGPGRGVPGCRAAGDRGCWADRHIVLGDFDGVTPVMGAAMSATGDRSPGDRGGPSLAVTLASTDRPPADLTFTWEQVLAAIGAGTITPRDAPPAGASAAHVPDPAATVPPSPDYVASCAAGVDSSGPCVQAVLQAVNNARAAEGVKPMELTPGFERLSVPDQLLVAINLERVDRGLAPFTGRTPALDVNAQQGADRAGDPPDPGTGYAVVDSLWAGGSSNGLDAVYGWMYDDGPGSANVDCPPQGGPGCWGHRHGILDDFGSVGTVVMGAAVNPEGGTAEGGTGPSVAATLAVVGDPPPSYSVTWDQARTPR